MIVCQQIMYPDRKIAEVFIPQLPLTDKQLIGN